MLVLVTGASGFIGQPLVRRLLELGHRVRALVRPDTAEPAPAGAESVRGDMRDAAALDGAARGMEAIVHLACATGIADERIARAVNVEGTRALLDAARRHRVGRFVFISTISAMRRRLGPYGRTKREGERLVADSGLPWVTLRPSLVYGPGDAGLFARLSSHLRTLPVVPVIGDGSIEIDPIHVDDVCAVIVQCLERADVLGRTYDLPGPERVTFNDFLARLSRLLGVRKPVVHIPAGPALALASALGAIWKRPPVSVDNVLGMTSPATVDRETAPRVFAIRWTSLDAGLRALADAAGGAAGFRAA